MNLPFFRGACSSNSARIVILLSVTLSGLANAASFDCAKAKTETEILICQDPELSDLDEQLHVMYFDILSAITDKAAQVPLRAIQREWLKNRDETPPRVMTKRAYILFSYRRQLSRLEFFQKNKQREASLENPDMQEILRLLVKEKLPGLSRVKKIDEGLYLLSVSECPAAVVNGYYGANLKRGLLQQLSGFGTVVHDIRDTEPVLVIKNMSSRQNIQTINVTAIYRAENKLGLDSRTLASVRGICSRVQPNTVGDIKVSSTPDGLLIALDLIEEDCKSHTAVSSLTKKYLFKAGILEELVSEN